MLAYRRCGTYALKKNFPPNGPSIFSCFLLGFLLISPCFRLYPSTKKAQAILQFARTFVMFLNATLVFGGDLLGAFAFRLHQTVWAS